MNSLKKMRIKLPIAFAAIVFAGVSTFVTARKASMTDLGRTGSSVVMADAAADYAAQCAVCHGTDGRSQTPKGRKTHAADLTKSTASDAKGIRIITNGRDEMPGFGKILSADQISAVMEYTHRFRSGN